jgi:hypothetical protein
MATHIRVIAWLHIVFGGLGLLCALAALLFFGGIAGLIGMTIHSPDARVAIPIAGVLGGVAFVVIALIALPGLIAGIGLLGFRPWARIVTIILSAIHLINVPVGTVLGVYGLWALLSTEGARLFEQPPPVVVQPR